MKLYCKNCGKQCSNEIPKDKEKSFEEEWNECPLCVACIIKKMKERIEC